VKVGESKTVTFIDGHLTSDGMFQVGFANEHNVKFGQKSFEQYQCLQDHGKDCGLCHQSNNVKNGPIGYGALKGMFSLIDHTGYTRDDQTVVQHERKLLKAGKKTLQQLAQMVNMLGAQDGHFSLSGRSFQVSRSNDKSAGCGDVWIPINRYDVPTMLAQLAQQFPERANAGMYSGPIDYTKVLNVIDENQVNQIIAQVGGAAGAGLPYGATTGVAGGGWGAPAQQPQQQGNVYGSGYAPQNPPQNQPQNFAPQNNGGYPQQNQPQQHQPQQNGGYQPGNGYTPPVQNNDGNPPWNGNAQGGYPNPSQNQMPGNGQGPGVMINPNNPPQGNYGGPAYGHDVSPPQNNGGYPGGYGDIQQHL